MKVGRAPNAKVSSWQVAATTAASRLVALERLHELEQEAEVLETRLDDALPARSKVIKTSSRKDAPAGT